MLKSKTDVRRRDLAATVWQQSVEELHDAMAEAAVTRAYVVSENGELTLSHPRLLAPIQAFLELSHDFADHEGVFLGREVGIPTVFLAVVHDTRRGLAQGGLRYKPYRSVAALLVDGLRLAQGMTRKSALAGLWWGGGKGIVPVTGALDHETYRTEGTPERRALFEAYGRFVASLGGVYYTAEDIGTKTSDMNAILGQNRFVTCIGTALGGSGNPSPCTARGVLRGMQAGWRFLTGDDDLRDVRVVVQGVGNVGEPLVRELDELGARVWVSDINRRALEDLKARLPRIEIVDDPDSAYDLDVDILAPCAIGAVVNRRTIPRLKVKLVCGAANNVLHEPADAQRLRDRDIAYVPDYLCNRMGITNCCDESFGYLPADVELAAERVYPDTLRVLKHARREDITSAEAADQLADMAACELHPMMGHRGRRIIDRLVAEDWAGTRGERRGGERPIAAAFDPALHEPDIRVGWEREGRFRGAGGRRRDGVPTLAAAPISAAGQPELSSFFSALLMDVRARSLERLPGRSPSRAVGSEPGGLALQLAVERSQPWERDDIGRARFAERCRDAHDHHDAAIRRQLHLLGVGFDPAAWLDPTSDEGIGVVTRLFYCLRDAGLLFRETRRTYFDPRTEQMWIAPGGDEHTFFGGRRGRLIDLGSSEQLFVRIAEGARHLRQAIEIGAVTFSDRRWRARVEELLEDAEPWCISRQYWWGQRVPDGSDDVLSVWFTLAAWSLEAAGWPGRPAPEPIDEVFVDPDLLVRWVVPSQILSLLVAGRPAFRHVEVHGSLHVSVRELKEVEGAPSDAPDHERFVLRRARRPMRRRLGNVVEPETLIRRFGADALRLGLLLSLHESQPEVATASESQLRRARRAVQRLSSKVTGLVNQATREARAADAGSVGGYALADDWILARAAAARDEARLACDERRLADVGRRLADVIDDFARYAGLAAARMRDGGAGPAVGSTVWAVLRCLRDGFGAVCPFLFDRLTAWTAARAVPREDEPEMWIDELVSHLVRISRRRAALASPDLGVRRRLEAGLADLRRLARSEITVTGEPAAGRARVVGPCVVVLGGELAVHGEGDTADWYRSLHE